MEERKGLELLEVARSFGYGTGDMLRFAVVFGLSAVGRGGEEGVKLGENGDISNSSFYGPINSNFRSMIPDNGALLNIAGNFFYSDPMLYADGCQFCPSGVIQPLVLTLDDLTGPSGGRCGPQGLGGFVETTRAGANKRAEASLRRNCFTLNKQMECTANETQRSSDECLAFCSMSRELGQCDGHGACVPPQAGAAEARFTCECDDGFVPTNGTLGSTCARPAPLPPQALSTGAVVGIAVGSAAAFALLLTLVFTLLWPRQRRKWGDLDVCHEFSIGEILRATDHWSSASVLGKGGFATVYKGVSEKGEPWAIKRNELMSNDFEKEVRAMASLRHEHVVRLLGFCLHQNVESGQQEQILVYEFVPNGDLKFHIHDSKSKLPMHVLSHGDLKYHIHDSKSVATHPRPPTQHPPCPTPCMAGDAQGAGAARKVQAYEFSSLKDAALEASEDAVVEFDDIALDCVKVPGSRRPPMKDVARRLQALLSKYCSEGTCNPHEPSTRMTETMEESLEKLTGGGTGGDMDTFGKIDISEEFQAFHACPPMKDVARRLQALLSRHCSEGECAPLEPSMPVKESTNETMEESLERLTGGGRDRSGISEEF
ncbi:unnamed protein product [Closterium sp. Naga37s-1]|nr:unnamed protein product [Closterium sp. Naga37s-1]